MYGANNVVGRFDSDAPPPLTLSELHLAGALHEARREERPRLAHARIRERSACSRDEVQTRSKVLLGPTLMSDARSRSRSASSTNAIEKLLNGSLVARQHDVPSKPVGPRLGLQELVATVGLVVRQNVLIQERLRDHGLVTNRDQNCIIGKRCRIRRD